jgi:RNA polymerase sigma-70 factor (sigma-E family)
MGLGPDFDEFVNSYGTALLRAAFLLTGHHGDAEDLVQTTLMRVALRWRAVRQSPHAYAQRVLLNLSRNHWRDKARRPRVAGNLSPDEAGESVHAGFEQIGDRVLLRSALQGLSEHQREIVVMRFILDLSVAEIAAVLEIPEGSVKSATHRALGALREDLSQFDESIAMEVGHAD